MRLRPIVSILLLLAAVPASAHRPYAWKVKDLKSPHGETLVLERLFGDGIFSADPVSLQVRNGHGAVIAFTPVSQCVAVFCPSLTSCWAFPHDSFVGLTRPWRLEHASLEYDKRLGSEERSRIEENGSAAYGVGSPAGREHASGFKKDASILLTLAGPIFVLSEHGVMFGLLAFTIAFPRAARFLESRLTASGHAVPRFLPALRALLVAISAIVLVFVSLGILLFTAPWLYALVIAGLSHWVGKRDKDAAAA